MDTYKKATDKEKEFEKPTNINLVDINTEKSKKNIIKHKNVKIVENEKEPTETVKTQKKNRKPKRIVVIILSICLTLSLCVNIVIPVIYSSQIQELQSQLEQEKARSEGRKANAEYYKQKYYSAYNKNSGIDWKSEIEKAKQKDEQEQKSSSDNSKKTGWRKLYEEKYSETVN